MDSSLNNFEKDLDRLLEKYLGDGKLNLLNLNPNPIKEEIGAIPRMINKFYLNQLQIENNTHGERVKIDRFFLYLQHVS